MDDRDQHRHHDHHGHAHGHVHPARRDVLEGIARACDYLKEEMKRTNI
jgi:hypothetical protein